jgi:hypothetical protein
LRYLRKSITIRKRELHSRIGINDLPPSGKKNFADLSPTGKKNSARLPPTGRCKKKKKKKNKYKKK